eukprot:12884158-Prorocentrum_lima.AAC.1
MPRPPGGRAHSTPQGIASPSKPTSDGDVDMKPEWPRALRPAWIRTWRPHSAFSHVRATRSATTASVTTRPE